MALNDGEARDRSLLDTRHSRLSNFASVPMLVEELMPIVVPPRFKHPSPLQQFGTDVTNAVYIARKSDLGEVCNPYSSSSWPPEREGVSWFNCAISTSRFSV